ncbi:MAG: STAS domain-containing protein, partial [Acidobacteriota bacterium]
MAKTNLETFGEILRDGCDQLVKEWTRRLQDDLSARNSLLKRGELEEQGRDFLVALEGALARGGDFKTSEGFGPVREFLSTLSRTRARQGFTPSETAMFVLSLKGPLFDEMHKRLEKDPKRLAEETWSITQLLDTVGLFTIETYMKSREEIISRQQQELLELSTPVVRLWDGVLALPLIGTLDSARTQVVMESLLQAIVETGSMISIIDITGVPVVDTLVAQHLLKTVAAARLMGADCII